MRENKKEPRIRIIKDGPYIVSGGVPLLKKGIGVDDEGNSYKWTLEVKYPNKESYSLCRCGKSKNKPFCDGSHWLTPDQMEEWRKKWDKNKD